MAKITHLEDDEEKEYDDDGMWWLYTHILVTLETSKKKRTRKKMDEFKFSWVEKSVERFKCNVAKREREVKKFFNLNS